MCELRSTRVQTDRVLSVPGRRLLASRCVLGRCLVGRCLAPGSSPAHRLLASLRVLGRCLAPSSCPACRLLASRRALGRCLAPGSSPVSRLLASRRVLDRCLAPIWPQYRYARVGAPSYSGSAASDAWRTRCSWHRIPGANGSGGLEQQLQTAYHFQFFYDSTLP